MPASGFTAPAENRVTSVRLSVLAGAGLMRPVALQAHPSHSKCGGRKPFWVRVPRAPLSRTTVYGPGSLRVGMRTRLSG